MNEVGTAYDAAGAAWHAGPAQAYQRLAEALLDHSPRDLLGARVLDVGAGTGVAASAARRRGAALVVATDLAAGMLAHREPGTAAVVADATSLPFADRAFDLVVASFSLSHVVEPLHALRESRRVAPAVVASAFAPGWDHPAKQAVDDVMAWHGFVRPAWYAAMKARESVVEDPDRLAHLALEAGYASVEVAEVAVRTGIATPRQMVDWRWGMAHLAAFVAELPPDRRRRARADAEAVVDGMPPVLVPMLALGAA